MARAYFATRERLLGMDQPSTSREGLRDVIGTIFSDARFSAVNEREVEFEISYATGAPDVLQSATTMRVTDGGVVWSDHRIPTELLISVGTWLLGNSDSEVWLVSGLGGFARRVEVDTIAEVVLAHVNGDQTVDEDSPTRMSD